MTGAIGGGAINLATLWVPVLPEVSGFTSALAEGVIGGATMAIVSKFLDVFGEMVSKSVEGLLQIGEGVIKIGEQFQTLEYQVESFTDAQGRMLEGLKDSAATVFSQLDTSTKNLGQNLDVLHQRLGVAGPALEKLTYDFTELNDRLGNLDVRQFTAMLDAYGVSGDKADAALRTLAGNTQKYGDTLSNLTASMQTANPVFDQLGIGYNSAAEAMAKIDALGPNAMKVMNGLAMSGKEFAKLPSGGGEEFKKFISDTIDAINFYVAHGEEGKAQALTATFFGGRQWAIVLRSLQPIKDAMDGIGKSGNEINVKQFVSETETLDRMWTQFVHKLEYDLKPVGDSALSGLETGVKWLGDFLAAHEDEIVGKIKGWGDGFIQALPGIQRFVGEGIRLLGMFFEFMNVGTQAVMSNISLILQAWGTITNDDKLVAKGQGLMDMANTLSKVDFSKFTDGIANALESPTIDTNALQKKWDEAMGHVLDHAKDGQGGLGGGLGVDVHINPIAPDGSPLTDPNQLLPPAPDSGSGGASTSGSATSQGGVNRPWNTYFGDPSSGDEVKYQWPDGTWHSANDKPPNVALSSYDVSTGAAAGPVIAHTGDPNDPVHVAVVLSAFSAPLDGNTTQVPGGGWGKGGGGSSHAANKGYGSTGPADAAPGSGYDAPTDPRNQMPGKKSTTKSADPGDLIGPLMDMLGLGNVLGGTNPENWGIVKFAKSAMAFLNGDSSGAGGSGGASGGSGGNSSNTNWLLNALGMGHLNPGGSTGPGGGPGPSPGGPDDGSGGGPTPPDGSGPNLSAGPKGPWMTSGTGHTGPPPPPPVPATSYDQGGILIPGQTTAHNATGQPETVLPPGQGFIPANATIDQAKAGLVAMARARGIPENQIPGILAVGAAESNFGKEGFMGFSTKTTDTGYTAGAPYANDFNKSANQFLDNYMKGGLAAGGGPAAKAAAIAALNAGDPVPFAHWLQFGVQGAVPGAGGDPQANAAWGPNYMKAFQQFSGGTLPGGAPGKPGGPGAASSGNSWFPAFKNLLSAPPYPGAGPNVPNPLAFGLGLGANPHPTGSPGAGGPSAAPGAYPAGIGPFNYSGIKADTGSTATPGAIASTSNPQFGGIANAPSGKDQEILNFMQGQVNAFNQRTGSHLSVTADYPGGPFGHPDDGADHSVRRAMDVGGSQKDMDAFAAYWFNNPALRAATRQLIHDPELDKDPKNPFTGDMNIIGGKATSGPQTYAGAPYGPGPSGPGHTDHDHLAMQYIPDMNAPNVSAGPNVAPMALGLGGGPGAQAERRGDTHIHGDYMPMHVAPSAIDPKPAVTAMQDHQNSMVGRAGGFGGLPA